MKKYFIFIIFLFSIFISNINAIDIELYNKVIEFDQEDGFSLQGFSSNEKYLFMILINDDESKSMIKVYDINNYNLVFSNTGSSLGHANDVTYNSKDNMFYVAISGGSEIVYRFNGDDFSYVDSIDIGLPIRSITYIDDLDKYAVRLITSGYILDNEFNKELVPFVFGLNIAPDVGRQGWTYYNNLIYYCNWSWLRMGGDGSNTIQIYDLKGNYIDKLHTNNTVGEIEGVSFSNNKMIYGFNEYEGKVAFYVEDIPDIEIPEIILDNLDNTIDNDDDDEIKNNIIYDYIWYIIGFIVGILSIYMIKIIRKR